ncbi:MAG TPA: S-layer homology domain-containing protein [Anaerolineales bacterium]|nr:S-layer homology domain-containing protein [Anaerolineales bacterium]HMX76414.1 S-layer homology domain-containing protein [Anaerolineales bacterium]HNF36890.1 S-layer homology domain-containing protein [Anaerolineales bacterium]HUM27123.1 S-layer homology domain-containing protein [Anaerolineales bacterium]
MNKKVFTVLLLAVFVLAQFSMASAATLPGTGSITSIPELSSNAGVNIDWAATGLAGPTQNVLLWGKDSTAVAYMAADCAVISTVAGSGGASGTFTYSFAGVGNGDIWDFTVTVDSMTCGAATVPAVSDVMGSTTIDSVAPYGFVANPPSTEAVPFSSLHASCNTFELWGVASDRIYTDPDPYSGFNSWNFGQTGSFAPLGPDNSVLSQEITFPATANGAWSFTYNPSDMLGNNWGVGPFYFRNAVAVTPAELAGCADFTDVSGHATEVQVRYLADLGLIAGNPDGSFGVNSTLTRAEASALFEKANGYDASMLPVAPPSAACTFSDVSASDWFAGWVWQACADGFMNGLGGGLFGPADLLTRGQIVTIFNNIDVMGGGTAGSFLDGGGMFNTVLNIEWNNWGTGYHLRPASFSDVPIGQFYTNPVQYAYAVGVADGTSATTFSPDQPVLRGEFAKMLYRALSRV